MSLQQELTPQEIKRQIHNLRQKQSRLKAKAKDPNGFKQKERARHKKYWAELDPEKKKAKLVRQSELNKNNKEKTNEYQRKSYRKNKEKILEKKRLDRINRPEYYKRIRKKSYKKHRKKILAKIKQKREVNGDKMRARERELRHMRKKKNV